MRSQPVQYFCERLLGCHFPIQPTFTDLHLALTFDNATEDHFRRAQTCTLGAGSVLDMQKLVLELVRDLGPDLRGRRLSSPSITSDGAAIALGMAPGPPETHTFAPGLGWRLGDSSQMCSCISLMSSAPSLGSPLGSNISPHPTARYRASG